MPPFLAHAAALVASETAAQPRDVVRPERGLEGQDRLPHGPVAIRLAEEHRSRGELGTLPGALHFSNAILCFF